MIAQPTLTQGSRQSGAVRPLEMLFFLDYEDANGIRFKSSPGLLPLIGHTRAQGFEVRFVGTQAELLAAVQEPRVDVVGISSMERLLPRTIPLVRRLRELRPDLPLMIGGNAIDVFAEDLAAGLLDVVVLGEAEHILPALLFALAGHLGRRLPERPPVELVLPAEARQVAAADSGGALSPTAVDALLAATFHRRIDDSRWAEIGLSRVLVRDSERGAVWRLDGPVVSDDLAVDVDPTPREEELDDCYIIPWELMRQERWDPLELYAQRGCRWGQCHFCSVGDRNIRSISAAKTVEILAQAARHGIQMVSFADNLYVQVPAWNREVLQALVERRVPIALKAQTMAVRTAWPLLGLMREAGFFELAFGLETVLPERAVFMAKSFNGKAYVRQAEETVARTAEAGIFPVLYLIMVDPRSTLVEVAAELEAVIALLLRVYRRTGVVAKPSYSVVMLPVASTRLTESHAYHTRAYELGQRRLEVPENFDYAPEINDYLNRAGAGIRKLPRSRENLAAFPVYLESVVAAAREAGVPERQVIETHARQGMALYRQLLAELDADIEGTVASFSASLGCGMTTFEPASLDYRRFAPYVDGVGRFSALLSQALEHRRGTWTAA